MHFFAMETIMTVSTDDVATGDGDPLSIFREQLERAAARANRGGGLIYELYVERLSAEVSDLLATISSDLMDAATKLAHEYGYGDHEEECDLEPGACSLTGLDMNCCPCGRHP
ncbi:hypothetical protein AX777_23525 [Sphingobium yanoikuyae]|jgi:hypothetical protein|uniref:CcgAII protein n=2 Tax=Sphingobium yanoikuyae TaxID=13690 RepID=A0A177JED5_SPHYA|nr:hypothetical protein [Erythrobacter sp.]OAH38615.1 hypothetical protein AX777_23525 [Sphingobium yanoikuyae]|tara:strand:+ start:1559 stop:1897 length:339 start_codon:yes stop_codon:yes gene_type:complete